MRHPHSHLYLRIYLAVLASLALSSLLAALVWHVFYREPPVFTQLGTLARTAAIAISSAATPEHDQQTLNQLQQRFNVGLALYDVHGDLVAAAAAAAVPSHRPGTREGYVHLRGKLLTYVTPVDGQRWLLVQVDTPHGGRHLDFLFLLAMIAVVVAICAHPVVRRLTKRLERLKASVDRLGSGDLSGRVRVEGHDEVAAIAQ